MARNLVRPRLKGDVTLIVHRIATSETKRMKKEQAHAFLKESGPVLLHIFFHTGRDGSVVG